jgi:AcrR family transcriptional regulator
MGLREQQRAAQEQRLQEAAWDLFEAQGYEATTVEAIAAAAGVSVPTLFRYFPTKADLVVGEDPSLVEHVASAVAEARPGETLLEALRRAVVGGTVAATGDRLGRLRTRLMAESDELRRRQLDTDDRAIRRTARAIADRMGLPASDPRPRAIAAATHGIVRAALEGWRDDPAGRTMAEAVGAGLDALPEAWGLLGRSGDPASTDVGG